MYEYVYMYSTVLVVGARMQGTSESVSDWIEMLARHCELDGVLLAIVGNKCDLDDQRQITPQRAPHPHPHPATALFSALLSPPTFSEIHSNNQTYYSTVHSTVLPIYHYNTIVDIIRCKYSYFRLSAV